jgi:hypothetical protein
LAKSCKRLISLQSIRKSCQASFFSLDMAALVASRCNLFIVRNYQKLRAAGKIGKQALIACMRKHLVILDATLGDKTR